MNELIERITSGLSVEVSNESTTEPISIDDVKSAISMNSSITQHDTALNHLIKAVRIAIEDKLGVSLISRDVVSFWNKLYDFENLPYQPVKTAISSITVTDKWGNSIDSSTYRIEGVGGFLKIYGNFENGVKLTYQSGYEIVKESHKKVMIDMVVDIFTNNISISEALIKHSKHLSK